MGEELDGWGRVEERVGEEDPVEVEERLGAGQGRLDVWVEGNAVCHGAVQREGVGPVGGGSVGAKRARDGTVGVVSSKQKRDAECT